MSMRIYLRVSTEEQIQGFSLDAQKRATTEYAKAKGWTVVHIYVDAGYSAWTDRRPAFRQMVAAAQEHGFQAILLHKFDRFAHSRKDAVTYKALLKQCGVTVLSVSEPIDASDPSGIMTEGMLEVMAEWYSANLSRETIKGKRARTQVGYQNNTTTTPFGYVKAAGRSAVAEINPETIGGYHLAVKLELQGQIDREVAWALNEAGYRTGLGRLFSKDSIADILEKRYCLGEVSYHREHYKGCIRRPLTWRPLSMCRLSGAYIERVFGQRR